jgi:RF-1 domain
VTTFLSRHQWTALTDDQLLAQCVVDTYRASGPGGQKRNKTSSAVRLRHPASGLLVIAEESRSQHENKARALRRMRQALFLKLRDELPEVGKTSEALLARQELTAVRTPAGRVEARRKDPRFWPAAGVVLDVLEAARARVSDAAKLLGISTGNLVDFLSTDPKLFEQANVLRQRHGQKPLKSD